jgi:undecaprenyl-diphosphatase
LTRRNKLKLLTTVAAAAAVLLLFLWLASEVYDGETLAFDNAIREWVHGFASDGMTQLALWATFMGSTTVVVTLGLLSLVGFLIVRDRCAAVVLAIIVTGEAILSVVLKDYYGRARPEPYFGYTAPTSFSFPSGHSFASFCLYLTLAWLLSRRVKTTAVAVILWITAILIVLLVGLSRIYLGVHYPTDVIGGYLAAAMWSSIVLFFYQKYTQRTLRVGLPPDERQIPRSTDNSTNVGQ